MNKQDGKVLKYNPCIACINGVYILSDQSTETEVATLQMRDVSNNQSGFTIEDLLKIALDRLTEFNDKVPDSNNGSAILGIQQALLHLARRTRNRTKAGIKGTDQIIQKRTPSTVITKRIKRMQSK